MGPLLASRHSGAPWSCAGSFCKPDKDHTHDLQCVDMGHPGACPWLRFGTAGDTCVAHQVGRGSLCMEQDSYLLSHPHPQAGCTLRLSSSPHLSFCPSPPLITFPVASVFLLFSSTSLATFTPEERLCCWNPAPGSTSVKIWIVWGRPAWPCSLCPCPSTLPSHRLLSLASAAALEGSCFILSSAESKSRRGSGYH